MGLWHAAIHTYLMMTRSVACMFGLGLTARNNHGNQSVVPSESLEVSEGRVST